MTGSMKIPAIQPNYLYHGSWYGSLGSIGSVARTGVAGRVFLALMYLPYPSRVSQIIVQIITAGGAGTKFRVGMYLDNGNTPVGAALMIDSGDIDATITGSRVIILATPQDMPAGFHWMCFETQDAVIQYQGYNAGGFPLDTTQNVFGCSFDQAYGALPALCPAVAGNTLASLVLLMKTTQLNVKN